MEGIENDDLYVIKRGESDEFFQSWGALTFLSSGTRWVSVHFFWLSK